MRSFLIVLALGAVAPQDIIAQAVIKGRISAAQSGSPLALVEVLIENLKIRAWTNDSGEFRIANLPIGSHELRVRRVGFEGAVATLKVESADSLDIAVSLTAWIPELETIYVKAPRRSRLMQELEEKRKTGFGRFLLPEEMRENEHRPLMDVVRQMGVEVLVDPKTNLAYAVGRKTPSISDSPPTTMCVMTLMVNGVRVAHPDLNKYQVSQFDGIELYRRISETPIQYTATGDQCGVLILWTRGT
ncbi:MAG: carboxypeptidase regulatory-like domain-containing protein [Gemmatimonadales bacterium]